MWKGRRNSWNGKGGSVMRSRRCGSDAGTPARGKEVVL